MLFCPKCQQLEATSPQRSDDGSVTYICKKCGSVIPLRRDLKPGEVVAGFVIEEELGRGAMGIVYQARQTNLDREVAIKILSDDSASDEVYVERFFREARAAASLSHPNVVQAYDAGVTSDGIYYFVMEKVTGENLDLVLNNVGPLSIPQALDVFLSVANALSYAWSRNQLSHGDIKPEHIIMRLNGKIKLADFGLARKAKDPELAEEDIRATPAYAPPEIIRGDKGVPGFKSDMYSFGATAYHILCGHEPFIDSDPFKVCDMQISDVQTPLTEINPNIPQRLSDLVDTLMEKDPARRPASWDDVIAELNIISEELKNAPDPATYREKKAFSGPAIRHWVKKKLRLTVTDIVELVILVLVIIGGVILLQHKKHAENVGAEEVITSGSENARPVSTVKPKQDVRGTEVRPVRDRAYYAERWKEIRKNLNSSKPSSSDLRRLQDFLAEAGSLAPTEAVKMLDKLQSSRNAESARSRVLELRSELLSRADSFRPESVKGMEYDRLDSLYQSCQSKFRELQRLDDSLEQRILQPEQKKRIEAYLRQLADIQLSLALGGDVSDKGRTENTGTGSTSTASTGTKPASASAASSGSGGSQQETATEKTFTQVSDKHIQAYHRILGRLPDTIANEAVQTTVIRMIGDLLEDSTFEDKELRKNCIDIRNFLQLNQKQFLPFLIADKEVLHGMTLFPNKYPDGIVEEIGKNVIQLGVLAVSNTGAGKRIRVGVSWAQLRREEGEDRIVVTLVNSPQLAKLSESFREYLFVRALFLGVDQDMLVKRFNRASGLSKEKMNELSRTAKSFRSLDEEDD